MPGSTYSSEYAGNSSLPGLTARQPGMPAAAYGTFAPSYRRSSEYQTQGLPKPEFTEMPNVCLGSPWNTPGIHSGTACTAPPLSSVSSGPCNYLLLNGRPSLHLPEGVTLHQMHVNISPFGLASCRHSSSLGK